MPMNKKQTSKKVATDASKQLRTSKSKTVKEFAGTAVAQARGKSKVKKSSRKAGK